MTLGEKEKSVIQQGAYIVIKSHVKNANTHHPLSLALSQHFLSEQLLPTAKKKEKHHRSVQRNTLILIIKTINMLFIATEEGGLFIWGCKTCLNAAEISFKIIFSLCQLKDDQTERHPPLLQSPFQQWLNSHRSRGHPEQPYHIPTPLNHGNHITWPSPMTSNHWHAGPICKNLNATDFLLAAPADLKIAWLRLWK